MTDDDAMERAATGWCAGAGWHGPAGKDARECFEAGWDAHREWAAAPVSERCVGCGNKLGSADQQHAGCQS